MAVEIGSSVINRWKGNVGGIHVMKKTSETFRKLQKLSKTAKPPQMRAREWVREGPARAGIDLERERGWFCLSFGMVENEISLISRLAGREANKPIGRDQASPWRSGVVCSLIFS
jgi:hypothetical protein